MPRFQQWSFSLDTRAISRGVPRTLYRDSIMGPTQVLGSIPFGLTRNMDTVTRMDLELQELRAWDEVTCADT